MLKLKLTKEIICEHVKGHKKIPTKIEAWMNIKCDKIEGLQNQVTG